MRNGERGDKDAGEQSTQKHKQGERTAPTRGEVRAHTLLLLQLRGLVLLAAAGQPACVCSPQHLQGHMVAGFCHRNGILMHVQRGIHADGLFDPALLQVYTLGDLVLARDHGEACAHSVVILGRDHGEQRGGTRYVML